MEALLNFQLDLSSRIKKAYTNYKKSSKERLAVKSYTDARLDSLEQLWLEFLSGHKEIMRNYSPRELKDTSYLTDDLYSTTEEIYIDYKCELKEVLKKFSCDHQTVTTAKSSQVKLPKINIPTFSGKYSEWSTFRDLFLSLVHTNDSLVDVQKLHYLKGYLTGEPEQLLRYIPIVDANYNRCWNILEERYNNKRYVCHHILQRLLGQKNIVNESASSLKALIDTTNDCLHALSNLDVDIKGWDVMVIHILTMKLDPESRRQWEFNINQGGSLDVLPSYKQFEEFITNRYRAIEFLESGSITTRDHTYQDSVKRALHVTNINCEFCSKDHRLSFCKGFAKETVDARRIFVGTNGLCFICLRKGHVAKYCRYKGRCKVCGRKHHSLLHPQGNATSITVDNRNATNGEDKTSIEDIDADTKDTIVSCFSTEEVYSHQLLATALVMAKSKRGSYPVRALLDQGSQSCFITEASVQLLGLRKNPVKGQISGLGEQASTCKAMVVIDIESRVDPSFTVKIEAYVLKTITTLLPAHKIDCMEWPEIKTLTLADPGYSTPDKIDLLLGAGVYGKIIQSGVKRGPIGAPVAQASALGWVLFGEIKTKNKSSVVKALHCHTDDTELLKKCSELESEAELPGYKVLKEEEIDREHIFARSTYRDEGRYVVKLPFRTDEPKVDNSQAIAEKRFYSLEHRLNKRKALKETYTDDMNEYLFLNHMELGPDNERKSPKTIYLPHHAVLSENKNTTKLKIVSDTSCKYLI